MIFLNPLGFLFLALVPLVVLLYLRRARRRNVTMPTLLFWERALGEHRHRAFLGKLRQWLSLLLHLLILALLVLALVRPEPARLRGGGESTVILLDTRARMQAVEPGGETRFAKALETAQQAAAGAGEGRAVAILAAGATPEVIAPFTADPHSLLERLKTVAPADTTGDLRASLGLARELLATRPGSHRILLLTDGSDDAPPAAPDLERVAVGTPLDNVAITRFAVRPALANPRTADLLLEVANFGRQRVSASVEIECDGVLLDVRPFSLEPGARKTDTFPALPSMENGSGKLTAKISAPDALPLDNIAYATLAPFKPLKVLLVTQGNWFLEKLLAADDSLKFDLLNPDTFQPAMGANFDAVLYDRCGPDDLAALAGNGLFLKAGPLGQTGTLADPLITDSDAGNPLLRFVDWRDVIFLKAAEIAPPVNRGGWSFQIPLRSFDHPLIVTGEKARQRLAVFAFDVAESDLPLRVAFPLLISNTLRWLADQTADPAGDIAAGQPIPLAPGEKTATARPMHNGFHAVEGDEGTRWIAVNTFSDAESNLAAPGAPGAEEHSRSWALAAPGGRPLWVWLALVATLLFTLEWWLFHRRQTE